MSLKEQRYVCTLARCGTIAKASEELYISPSALSGYISNLERTLGFPLFNRDGRSFTLTLMGEEYVLRAKQMLSLQQEFDELVARRKNEKERCIHLGIQQRRNIYLMPYLLRQFSLRYPQTELVITDGNHEELLRYYHEGKLDYLLIMDYEELPAASLIDMGEESILLAVPKDHPVNTHAYEVEGDPYPHLDMEHLHDSVFLLPEKGQSLRRNADNLLQMAAIKPSKIIVVQNLDLMMNLVNEGFGVGFNRRGYVKYMPSYENVSLYLIGRRPVTSRLVLACRRGKPVGEDGHFLIKVLREIL